MYTRYKLLKLFYKEAKPEFTYSSIMRMLNKKDPDKIPQFMKEFKEAFDKAMEEGLEDSDKIALVQAIKRTK